MGELHVETPIGSLDISVGIGGAGGGPPAAPAAAPAAAPSPASRTPAKPSKRGTSDGSEPDPVGELRFAVLLGDATAKKIGIFSECSGLQVEYEIMEYPEGGQNDFVHKLRGRKKYPNLVLKRGITHEPELLKWLFETKKWQDCAPVTVQLVGPDTKPIRTWAFANAFPVKWTGPTLNAGSNNAATETLEIAHRGLVEKP